MRLRRFEFEVPSFEFKRDNRDPKPETPNTRLASAIFLTSLQAVSANAVGCEARR
jgi:hypothetical protein